ncbi:hypothetical protein MtrunA17_Chr7g0266921 [Medicago truncatula]|uniref:Uncharacterized protein n=1 Tax=Medicago truncatula TaxID=3880 RepID=A0A396H7I5_MEDTR|nr:hypothetical protein MtrunA17_Chr7g0266921 [Medicago truncatula]
MLQIPSQILIVTDVYTIVRRKITSQINVFLVVRGQNSNSIKLEGVKF